MGALVALAFLPARARAALPQSLGSAPLEPAPGLTSGPSPAFAGEE